MRSSGSRAATPAAECRDNAIRVVCDAETVCRRGRHQAPPRDMEDAVKRTLINDGWTFYKGVGTPDGVKGVVGEKINLPHTWNNLDGQDGGGDYLRCACLYTRPLTVRKTAGRAYYLEFKGVSSIAEAYVNGVRVVCHEGGFGTFRADVTAALADGENTIAVVADNSPNDYVYPQSADFTFFGGIYRDVYLLEAGESRFDLDYYGGSGVTVTSVPQADGSAEVAVRAFVTSPRAGQKVRVRLVFAGKEVAAGEVAAAEKCGITFTVRDAHLWEGRKNPALYTAEVSLVADGETVDDRTTEFGIRTVAVDKDGFVLNGRRYPLRGVCRHQDRQDMGWAITMKEHEEDAALICEVGANTVRLAHYQQDERFYSLCDRLGLVVWAEIPYISAHLERGDANAENQLRELIVQNFNHPSIAVWGLSNEITIGGEKPEIVALHRRLNDIAHSLDPTRLTTVANVTMLDPDSELTRITDTMSYNHYFGWYMGTVEDNAKWFDDFRARYPDRPVGISEYGCEAVLRLHSSAPKQGDYSEEYQAYYHENLLRIIEERPYLWATHLWNMFDFAVDGRSEGGVSGRNNKGLVTYDRKTKKDSFYLYKAAWSDEPFVHIASKRYVKRAEKVTKVKVYSNQSEVVLFVNGREFARKTGKRVFEFAVPLRLLGATRVTAVAGECRDEAVFRRVRKPVADYALPPESTEVVNWFEKDGVRYEFEYPEGRFSVKDKIGDIIATEEGEALIMSLAEKAVAEMKARGRELPFKLSKGLLRLVSGMTVESIAAKAGGVPAEYLYNVNKELNKIEKK